MVGVILQSAFLQLLGNNSSILSPEVQGILTLLFMAISLTFLYYVMIQMQPKKTQESYETVTVLKCLGGSGSVTERPFQKGDFVGKVVGECAEKIPQVIHAIYERKAQGKK
ncbi:MAG: hypothetical protein ACPLSO_06735 [Fervidicoccaceae archaeon]